MKTFDQAMQLRAVLDNPFINAQERKNNLIPIKDPSNYIDTSCECGQWEARAIWKGQKLCEECLDGIVGVKLL